MPSSYLGSPKVHRTKSYTPIPLPHPGFATISVRIILEPEEATMSLSRIKILHKLLLLVGLLTLVTAIVAAVGLIGLDRLSKATNLIDAAGNLSLTAARANQNVIALNRAEFRMAADPSADQLRDVRAAVEEERARYTDRIARLRAGLDAADDREGKALLEQAEAGYRAYMVELDDTLQVAEAASAEVVLSDAQARIRDSALRSRAAAVELQTRIRAVAEHLSAKATAVSDAASAQAERLQALMLVVALGGVLGGFAAGYGLARFGISMPI
ncbi:MAG: hypothetical protein RLY86_2924, partial [Pseudomonadota bacterium]